MVESVNNIVPFFKGFETVHENFWYAHIGGKYVVSHCRLDASWKHTHEFVQKVQLRKYLN